MRYGIFSGRKTVHGVRYVSTDRNDAAKEYLIAWCGRALTSAVITAVGPSTRHSDFCKGCAAVIKRSQANY